MSVLKSTPTHRRYYGILYIVVNKKANGKYQRLFIEESTHEDQTFSSVNTNSLLLPPTGLVVLVNIS